MAIVAPKGPKKLERHFKGVANHRRIQILMLIEKRPNILLLDIADTLRINLKTASEHTRRLAVAGLVEKVYEGTGVQHKLSRYGKLFMKFIDEFSKIRPANEG